MSLHNHPKSWFIFTDGSGLPKPANTTATFTGMSRIGKPKYYPPACSNGCTGVLICKICYAAIPRANSTSTD